jgi:hypothetical protein
MDTLQAGITAAREGRREEARELLQQALQADPRSEQGWLWMSAVVETDDERRICLERVLTINPKNQTAQAGLEKLGSADGLGDSVESYLPVSQSTQAKAEEPRQAATGPLTEPPSPHTMPTVGLDPVMPGPRPIERLVPQPEPAAGLAALRAAQYSPPGEDDASSYQAQESSSEPDPFMALILIGGLSITAIAGALMLGVLWLIGWPP